MLGTYTTIDCPTQFITAAWRYLERAFGTIGGKVRRELNPHENGSYPSFEVDYPEDWEEKDEKEKEEWHKTADEITKIYYERYKKYL